MSEIAARSTDDELRLVLDRGPGQCEIWRHRRTGRLYEVITTALEKANLSPVVVYRSRGKLLTFTRPLAEWLERFTPLSGGCRVTQTTEPESL